MVKLPKNTFAVLWGWDEEELRILGTFRVMSGSSIRRSTHLWDFTAHFVERKNVIRPYKVEQRLRRTTQFLKSKEFTEALGYCKHIVFPHGENPHSKQLEEYFRTFGIEEPRVARICWYCFNEEQKVTLLRSNHERTYYNKPVCDGCLKKELKKELAELKISIEDDSLDFFDREATRLGSLDELLERVEYGDKYNEPFLFDVLQAEPLKDLVPLSRVRIAASIREALRRDGISELLPVQEMAIRAGLLRGQDQIVVADTSAGKTLVAELAGVKAALSGKKFVFLVPLVSLANQKYHDFRRRYSPIGLRVAIRVGLSRISRDRRKTKLFTDYAKADIIVATYEAFDFILRSGNAPRLGPLGVVAVDEFQLLADTERGPLLDGMIARLRAAMPQTQKLYLSATVGNLQTLEEDLDAKVVSHKSRPIPIERHLLIASERADKIDLLASLVRQERSVMSSAGYQGRTIVFTNSRRGTRDIAQELVQEKVRASYYHGGLSYHERRRVEEDFSEGKLECVVTTAALGAGVDFPASQVVFETLAMGARWITTAEFHQMLGRAGRFGYHDRGKVVLMIEPGREMGRSSEDREFTEDKVAFRILTRSPEPIEPTMEPSDELGQILASVAMYGKTTVRQLAASRSHMIGAHISSMDSLKRLEAEYMLRTLGDEVAITKLGRATTISFLSPLDVADIRARLKKEDVLDIALSMTPITNVYVAERVQADLERLLKTRLSSRFFTGGILDAIGERAGLETMTSVVRSALTAWGQRLLGCEHAAAPFCGCPERKLKYIILDRRMKGQDTRAIGTWLRRELFLHVFPNDLHDWLERLMHTLEGLGRIAGVLQWREIQSTAKMHWRNVENPSKSKAPDEPKPVDASSVPSKRTTKRSTASRKAGSSRPTKKKKKKKKKARTSKGKAGSSRPKMKSRTGKMRSSQQKHGRAEAGDTSITTDK